MDGYIVYKLFSSCSELTYIYPGMLFVQACLSVTWSKIRQVLDKAEWYYGNFSEAKLNGLEHIIKSKLCIENHFIIHVRHNENTI